jgi:hypothetical protein
MLAAGFALGTASSTGTSLRLVQAAYNARAHAVTLTLGPARRTIAAGTIPLIVRAALFPNVGGQLLDGDGDGTAGDDFSTTLPLG